MRERISRRVPHHLALHIKMNRSCLQMGHCSLPMRSEEMTGLPPYVQYWLGALHVAGFQYCDWLTAVEPEIKHMVLMSIQ